MREILFRGKTFNDKWVEGALVKWSKAHSIIRKYGSDTIGLYEYSVVPETVGQYTGLTDKNGKKIFEGDILHVKQCGEMGVGTCAIYFGEYIDADSDFEDYRCIGFYLKLVDECFSIGVLLDSDFEFEVIGNIYDDNLEELANGR